MTARRVTLAWPDADRLCAARRAALLGPGAPFEMTTTEVLGRSESVFVKRAANLREVFLSGTERFAQQPYITFPDAEYTYGALRPAVASIAAALRDRHGVGKGDRVAIVAANCPEFAVVFWAAVTLGAIAVALNGWWTGPEISYGVNLTEPKVIFGDARRLARVSGVDFGVPVVEFESAFAGYLEYDPAAAISTTPIAEDDPYVILFTSGTTGRPKGALLSHRNNIAFVQSAMLGAAARNAILAEQAAANGSPPLEQPNGVTASCTLNASPMFHISGLNAQVVMSMFTGGQIAYAAPGKWREDVFLEMTAKYRPAAWSLVPTQLWRLLEWPGLEGYDLSSVRSVGGGSAVWAPELLRALERKLPWMRPGLATGFGMTETSGAGTSLKPPDTYEHPESIGVASPGVEVEVRDPDTHAALGEGEVGEVCLRGAMVFLGYWNNAPATEKALGDDRWYRTGDFGYIADGFVYLQGRRSDLIIRAGENISPIEIENCILEHADVLEVAVIGVEHPVLGQEVKAIVVIREVGAIDADDVRRWVSESLSAFKVPAHVEFVTSMPHNASGKVMKHLLATPGATSDFIEE